jgi:hypothetical protein
MGKKFVHKALRILLFGTNHNEGNPSLSEVASVEAAWSRQRSEYYTMAGPSTTTKEQSNFGKTT